MSAIDLDRLERLALAQHGKEIGAAVAVTPRELMELVRLARIGQGIEEGGAAATGC